MPTSFLSADAGFPRLTADVPAEERMNRIRDYLFLLLEQLRYVLSNLGEENFNDAALRELEEKMTGPLRSVVTDLQGNVSSLEQTAQALTARVSDAEGNIASLELTAEGLTTRVSDAEGNISSLEQTATSLTSRVSDAEGNISLVSQKADRIDWIVASGTSAANMTLTPEAIDLVAQGINISGYVTFSSLENAGQSVINGDNIELKADASGDSVSYLTYKSVNGSVFAQVHTRDNDTGTTSDRDRYAFVIGTPATVDGDYCAMKLEAGDSMSLEAGHLLYMQAATQLILQNGAWPTRITAGYTAYNPSSAYCQQADTYYFASDGIWFNGTRILST